MISKELLEILACPYHLSHQLKIMKNSLKCEECNREYELINHNGQYIPNFMQKNLMHNWSEGYRDNNNILIKHVEGNGRDSIDTDSFESILDIGCGETPKGKFNIDCYLPKTIPKNFILANVENLPIKNKSVDVVTSYYNLEHLVSPADFLIRASQIARLKIEIVTDNSDWIGDFVFLIMGSGRIFHDEHYFKWSRIYLKNFILRLGFNTSKVECINLSRSWIVRFFSIFGRIPRIGQIFYRDLHATIITG